MAIERGFIDFTLLRQDKENYEVTFFDSPGGVDPTLPVNQTPVDIAATYDEILMEIRETQDFNSKLIKRLTLTNGDFIISDTNNVSFSLQNDFDPDLYYYDMRFKVLGTLKDWETLVSGTVNNQSNISRT